MVHQFFDPTSLLVIHLSSCNTPDPCLHKEWCAIEKLLTFSNGGVKQKIPTSRNSDMKQKIPTSSNGGMKKKTFYNSGIKLRIPNSSNGDI